MKTYIVTVKVTTLDYYEIEAASAEEAIETWQDGRFLGADDAYLSAEPLKAKRKGERP